MLHPYQKDKQVPKSKKLSLLMTLLPQRKLFINGKPLFFLPFYLEDERGCLLK